MSIIKVVAIAASLLIGSTSVAAVFPAKVPVPGAEEKLKILFEKHGADDDKLKHLIDVFAAARSAPDDARRLATLATADISCDQCEANVLLTGCYDGVEYASSGYYACYSCGFGDDASDFTNCLSCPTGYEIDVMFTEGTGACVIEGTASDPLYSSSAILPCAHCGWPYHDWAEYSTCSTTLSDDCSSYTLTSSTGCYVPESSTDTHQACATCGFYDNPIDADDCVTCEDGYEIDKVYDDCSGYCVLEGTASTPLEESDCEMPCASCDTAWDGFVQTGSYSYYTSYSYSMSYEMMSMSYSMVSMSYSMSYDSMSYATSYGAYNNFPFCSDSFFDDVQSGFESAGTSESVAEQAKLLVEVVCACDLPTTTTGGTFLIFWQALLDKDQDPLCEDVISDLADTVDAFAVCGVDSGDLAALWDACPEYLVDLVPDEVLPYLENAGDIITECLADSDLGDFYEALCNGDDDGTCAADLVGFLEAVAGEDTATGFQTLICDSNTTYAPSLTPVPSAVGSYAYDPTTLPVPTPTMKPTFMPTPEPTATFAPTSGTPKPTMLPIPAPTIPHPSLVPVPAPTLKPTMAPIPVPTSVPTPLPTPTDPPTRVPTMKPTFMPTHGPTATFVPTTSTQTPTFLPTPLPTPMPSTSFPSMMPVPAPSSVPIPAPTMLPVPAPTLAPTMLPSPAPTMIPTPQPTPMPSHLPTTTFAPTAGTQTPSTVPLPAPTPMPSTSFPSMLPTPNPTLLPSFAPTMTPVPAPTSLPTFTPTSGDTTTIAVVLTLAANAAPTDTDKTNLKNSVKAAVGVPLSGIRNFVVTYTTRRRRALLAGTWTTTFDVVASVATVGSAVSFQTQIDADLVDSSFVADVEASVSSVTGVEGVTSVIQTRNPSSAPVPAPTAMPTVMPVPVPTSVPIPAPTSVPVPAPTVTVGNTSNSKKSSSNAASLAVILIGVGAAAFVLIGGGLAYIAHKRSKDAAMMGNFDNSENTFENVQVASTSTRLISSSTPVAESAIGKHADL